MNRQGREGRQGNQFKNEPGRNHQIGGFDDKACTSFSFASLASFAVKSFFSFMRYEGAWWIRLVELNRWVQLILSVCSVVRRQREGHDRRNIFGNVCTGSGITQTRAVLDASVQILELLIPPPAVTLLIASAMWGVTWVAPSLEVQTFPRITVAVVIALVGFSFALAGIVSIRRAKTTVNPKNLSDATSLVSSGIYRVTRNPMYVGLLFVLVAWAVFLSCVWALLGPLAFVLYMNRFQISLEENALAAIFGSDYSTYRRRVRRWL